MVKTLERFTKYEKARVIGARALQLSMDAPVLLKLKDEDFEKLNYDSLKIAQKELDEGVLPISINRPLPERKDIKLKKIGKEAVPSESPLQNKDEETEEEASSDLEPTAETDAGDSSMGSDSE
jgi:DNA-directed RNA polymerase subunit K